MNSTIGKSGKLYLKFKKKKDKVILSDAFSKMPMAVSRSFYLDDTGIAYFYLVNPTGGLVGGDVIDIIAIAEKDAHVFISTPSATKIYMTIEHPSIQNIKFIAKSNSILEYMPKLNIPFAGSAYEQRLNIIMEENSIVFLLDFFITGRNTMGEHFHFKYYKSSLEIIYDNELIITDRMFMQPDEINYNETGFMEGYNVMATMYFVFHNPIIEKELCGLMQEELEKIEKENIIDVHGGVSALSSHGIAVRFLAANSMELEKHIMRFWLIARKKVLDLNGHPAFF